MLFLGLPWSHTLGTIYFCSRPSGHAANSNQGLGGAVCSGRKWLMEGRGQDRLLLVLGVVALGNLSPHRGPVVAWPLPCLFHWAVTALDWKERLFLLGTRPIGRRIWVHEESALGGVDGNRSLVRGSFFQASRFHLTEKGTCLQQ